MILLWVAMMVSACAPQAAPTADPTLLALSVSIRVTELAMETMMAYVSPTPTLTPLPTDTTVPVVTPSPTVYAVDFTGHEVFTAYLADGQAQVSIIVPNGIEGDHRATIDAKEFSCFSYVMKAVPRLICNGPSLPRGTFVKMTIYPKDSQVPIFEKQFATPY